MSDQTIQEMLDMPLCSMTVEEDETGPHWLVVSPCQKYKFKCYDEDGGFWLMSALNFYENYANKITTIEEHGFDRNASHAAEEYVCICGKEKCEGAEEDMVSVHRDLVLRAIRNYSGYQLWMAGSGNQKSEQVAADIREFTTAVTGEKQ